MRRAASAWLHAGGRARGAAVASSLTLAAGIVLGAAGCGGASKTVVVTQTVGASSAAAARAAAAAQIAAATHGASKTAQVPSTSTPASSAPSSAAGSAAANPGAQKVVSGVLADADAICTRRNGELSALSKEPGQQASARRAAIEQRALGEMAALRPPPSAARAYRQVLDYSRIALSHSSKAGAQGQLRLMVAAVRAGVKHCSVID
jgi:hypothetical protein